MCMVTATLFAHVRHWRLTPKRPIKGFGFPQDRSRDNPRGGDIGCIGAGRIVSVGTKMAGSGGGGWFGQVAGLRRLTKTRPRRLRVSSAREAGSGKEVCVGAATKPWKRDAASL